MTFRVWSTLSKFKLVYRCCTFSLRHSKSFYYIVAMRQRESIMKIVILSVPLLISVSNVRILLPLIEGPQMICEVLLFTQYCAGDKIEKNGMGRACGTYGGREWCAVGFGWET